MASSFSEFSRENYKIAALRRLLSQVDRIDHRTLADNDFSFFRCFAALRLKSGFGSGAPHCLSLLLRSVRNAIPKLAVTALAMNRRQNHHEQREALNVQVSLLLLKRWDEMYA